MQEDKIIMDLEKIKSLIPQRSPLLLIDSVHEFIPHERIVASRFLSTDEPVFAGHFPGNPIYPGVYYIESIAQAGAVLLFASFTEISSRAGLLTGVQEARFRRPCVPGERVRYEVLVEKKKHMFFWLAGKAYVGEELAAEVKLSVALTEQSAKK